MPVEDRFEIRVPGEQPHVIMTINDEGDGSPQKCMAIIPLIGFEYCRVEPIVNNTEGIGSGIYPRFEMSVYIDEEIRRRKEIRKEKGWFRAFLDFFKLEDNYSMYHRPKALFEYDRFFGHKDYTDELFFEMEYMDKILLKNTVFIFEDIAVPSEFHKYSTELAYSIIGIIRLMQFKKDGNSLLFKYSSLKGQPSSFMSISEPGAEYKRTLKGDMPLLAYTPEGFDGYDTTKLFLYIEKINNSIKDLNSKENSKIIKLVHLYNEIWEYVLDNNYSMFILKSLSFLEGYLNLKKITQIPFEIPKRYIVEGKTLDEIKEILKNAIEERKIISHEINDYNEWNYEWDKRLIDLCPDKNEIVISILEIVSQCVEENFGGKNEK